MLGWAVVIAGIDQHSRPCLGTGIRRKRCRTKVPSDLGSRNTPRYEPCIYLTHLQVDARCRVYSFLLATLREHAPTLSNPPELRGTRGRYDAESRRFRAAKALQTVGAWWIDERGARRIPVTRSQRDALDLCARIMRLTRPDFRAPDAASRAMSVSTAALGWENRQWAKELRASRRAPRRETSKGRRGDATKSGSVRP